MVDGPAETPGAARTASSSAASAMPAKQSATRLRHRIAGILGLSPFQIGLKAKTGEGAGPVGREEVIEARCVALLEATGDAIDRSWVV